MMPFYRLVIIESPYRARTKRLAQRNVSYALAAMRDSINRGEAPFLSHMMYTGVLDDNNPIDRQLGIDLGYSWWPFVEAICFYCDLGWSEGMVLAKLRADRDDKIIEERYIAQNNHNQSESTFPQP